MYFNLKTNDLSTPLTAAAAADNDKGAYYLDIILEKSN